MVAHLDAVTSLAVDPNGLYLMSGSKQDSSCFHHTQIGPVTKIQKCENGHKSAFLLHFYPFDSYKDPRSECNNCIDLLCSVYP